MILLLAACSGAPALVNGGDGSEPSAELDGDAVVYVGTDVTFDAGGSLGAIFTWDFGDGVTGGGRTATHAYAVSFIVTNIPLRRRRGRRDHPRNRGLDPAPHRYRGPDPGGQARRGTASPALRTGKREPGLDVGSANVGNLSVLLPVLTGIDQNGRAHGARLRHQLPGEATPLFQD